MGLYVHNDVMQALGSPEKQLALLPVFAEWLQLAHGSHLGTTLTAGDFLVHHAIALGLHTTTLVLVKAAVNSRSSKHQRRAVIVHLNWVCIFLGFLFARGSRLVPDKARLGLVRVVEARVISLPSMGCISPSSGC